MDQKKQIAFGVGATVLAGIAIAVFVYSFHASAEPLKLEEKKASVADQAFRLLVPAAAELVEENALASFIARPDRGVTVVSVASFPEAVMAPGLSFQCDEQGKEPLLAVDIDGIERSVEVCENPLGIEAPPGLRASGYAIYGTSGFQYDEGERIFVLQALLREGFIETEEGEDLMQQIFSSFSLLNS